METEKYYVYKITNSINDKVYVGMTQDVDQRRRQHKCYGLRGYADNGRTTPLYTDMYELGVENFKIEVIEEVESKIEAENREAYWMQEFNSVIPNGYNQATFASHGWEWSEESKKKMSESKMGQCMNEDNVNSKPVICLETHEVYPSASEAGRKHNTSMGNIAESCRTYHMSNGFHFLYIEDWSEKLESEILLGKYIKAGKPVICVETGQWFPNAMHASKWAGLSSNGVARCCKGTYGHKTAGGYHWQYVD